MASIKLKKGRYEELQYFTVIFFLSFFFVLMAKLVQQAATQNGDVRTGSITEQKERQRERYIDR